MLAHSSCPPTFAPHRNLSSNKLAALPLQHMDLPNVTTVDLSQNTLSALPEITAPLLEQLDITGNFVHTLPDSFRSLKHLTKLFAHFLLFPPASKKTRSHTMLWERTGASATTA